MSKLPIQVYIMDDEAAVRTACARLVRSAKMVPRTFSTVDDFLTSNCSDVIACGIADVDMPAANGLRLLELLAPAGRRISVDITTAHDTPEIGDHAKQAGASAHSCEAVDGEAFLDALRWALASKPDENT